MAIWMAGQMVTVTRKKGRSATFEKLENVDDVWVMCIRLPPPGWRLLGRFYSPNVFVGLHLKRRQELGGKMPDGTSRYEDAAGRTIAAWSRRFGSIEPMRSSRLEDYICQPFWDLDDDTV
jgi:hypothetical protein